MSPFLTKAYIISSVIAVFVILIFSPPVLDFFFRYMGWGGYMLFSLGLLVWCVTFISLGIAFNPRSGGGDAPINRT